MKRRLLTLEEIHGICSNLRELFLFIVHMRKGSKLACYIKNPQIPSILSESLVVHLIRQGKILPKFQTSNICFGGRVADLFVEYRGKIVKVESKATAEQGFQRFRKKDVNADFLVWIHFATYFLNNDDTALTIYIIPNPGKYYEEGDEVSVHKIENEVGRLLQKTTLRLSQVK